MVDSKGNPSVPARGHIDDLARERQADRASERLTEHGDRTASGAHAMSSEDAKGDGRAGEKPGATSSRKVGKTPARKSGDKSGSKKKS